MKRRIITRFSMVIIFIICIKWGTNTQIICSLMLSIISELMDISDNLYKSKNQNHE